MFDRWNWCPPPPFKVCFSCLTSTIHLPLRCRWTSESWPDELTFLCCGHVFEELLFSFSALKVHGLPLLDCINNSAQVLFGCLLLRLNQFLSAADIRSEVDWYVSLFGTSATCGMITFWCLLSLCSLVLQCSIFVLFVQSSWLTCQRPSWCVCAVLMCLCLFSYFSVLIGIFSALGCRVMMMDSMRPRK